MALVLLRNRVSTMVSTKAGREFGKSSENRGSYILPLFFLFEMASSSNFNNVLKQLTAISRQLNSGEDALSELHVLKEHWDCDRVLAEACVEQQCQQRKCEVGNSQSCNFLRARNIVQDDVNL